MYQLENNKWLPLLYIGGSADDRALFKEAISLSGTHFAFYEADAIESAIAYFQIDNEGKQGPRPALVLLDYHPGIQPGIHFLYWLRLVKKIVSIPVIVFSGTEENLKIAECYSTGANYFITKPSDLPRLQIIVRTLHQSIADFPRPGLVRLLLEYRRDPREAQGVISFGSVFRC